MHKIALFFPKTAAFRGLRFETEKDKHVPNMSKKLYVYSSYGGLRLYMAGDGIAYALYISLINSETLHTIFICFANSTTAGFARTLRIEFISKSFCVILHKS